MPDFENPEKWSDATGNESFDTIVHPSGLQVVRWMDRSSVRFTPT